MDKHLIERGYREYPPTAFDNNHIVAMFQKRFDDDFGKQYFITVKKWSNDYIPINRRDAYWKPFSYEYTVQVTMHEDEKAINLEFFAYWNIEDVEKFMAEFFEKMKPNYYESWDEVRGVRPQ